MLIAVTERAGGEFLWNRDVYIATAAGMRISDPGTDLAVCLAVMSALGDRVVPLDTAVIGEVTLSGDVRPAPMMPERVAEAVRLGYQRVIVPVGTRARAGRQVGPARLVEVGTLREAILALQAPPLSAARNVVSGVQLRPVPASPD